MQEPELTRGPRLSIFDDPDILQPFDVVSLVQFFRDLWSFDALARPAKPYALATVFQQRTVADT